MNNSTKIVVFVIFLTHFGLHQSNGFRVVNVHGVETVLALENEEVVMSCEENDPMSYCGFIHPNGTKFSFTGSSLTHGRCHINLKVNKNDTGQWACRIGKHHTGIEVTKMKNLRVVRKLAALEPNIMTKYGEEVTLTCLTTEKMTPLTYCRFVSPNGVAFSIAPHFDRNSSLLGKYFFPANMSLDRGDCAVTIKQVSYEDRGTWTCSAWLEEEAKEFVDTVQLDIQGTAVTTGFTAGISLAVTLLLAGAVVAIIIVCKKCKQWDDSKEDIDFRNVDLEPQFTLPQVTVQYVSIANEAFMNGEDIYFK